MDVHFADTIRNYVHLLHFNIHGVQNRSGTHAASTTTAPPLFTSTACCGEWSMCKIFDIYFHFAAEGDFYLGQLLSFKDPIHTNFNVPCPHWKDPHDPIVLEGMRLTFGKIWFSHENPDHDPKRFYHNCSPQWFIIMSGSWISIKNIRNTLSMQFLFLAVLFLFHWRNA